MSEEIRLTIPRTQPFYGIARLVVGGLAARLDVSYEHLEDLQLALESLLANDAYAVGPDITVELVVASGAVEMRVGPLDGRRLRPELEREGEEPDGVGLRRLLGTVVERVELEQRNGGAWVRLEKQVRRAEK